MKDNTGPVSPLEISRITKKILVIFSALPGLWVVGPFCMNSGGKKTQIYGHEWNRNVSHALSRLIYCAAESILSITRAPHSEM